jgi:phosphoenolpyruvate---glycerone phosphotransferase subunit DhaM
MAWPMSELFREPQLVWVTPILGLTTFIHGFSSPRIMLLRRQLRPVPVMLAQLAGMISGSAVNIVGAWMGISVVALIAGALTQSLVETTSSHFLPGTHRPRLRIVPDCRTEIVSFGKWIFWSSCVLALAQRGDQITLGRLLGAAQVGVYGVALALAGFTASCSDRFEGCDKNLSCPDALGGLGGEGAPAGGTHDGRLGTSEVLLRDALDTAGSPAGVVVLADLGSAVLTTRMALEDRPDIPARLVDAPFVEGAVAAKMAAAAGADLDGVVAAAEEARAYRKL